MISMVHPLMAGNALSLHLEPPATALAWRILRKASDAFAGEDDPSAFVVYEGGDATVVLDTSSLANDVRAYYRAYATDDGVTWYDAGGNFGTPSSTYEETTTDVLSFMRERLECGLAEEVRRGALVSKSGYIRVYVATPTNERDQQFPLVTVHLDNEDNADRGLGEDITGLGDDTEGWLSSVNLTIIGWSLNADERSLLRQSIRRVILANFGIFDAKGWLMPTLSQQDVDAVSGEYPSHMYNVMNNFSCLAPVWVAGEAAGTTITNISERIVNYDY